jgi:hypothetical protein
VLATAQPCQTGSLVRALQVMNRDVRYWLGLFVIVAIVCLVAIVLPRSDLFKSKSARVSGKVTVSGRPLINGTITFYPDKGAPYGAAAAAVSDGEYVMEMLQPGDHAVALQGEGVPMKYSSRNSGMKMEVRGGANSVDVALP